MAEIRKLSEESFVASDIEDGDVLSIGGSAISDSVCRIKSDFSQLSEIFSRVLHSFAYSDMDGLRQNMRGLNLEVDPTISADLFLLQKIIEKRVWPENGLDSSEHVGLYRLNEETNLSDVFQAKQVHCVELSLFSAHSLKARGLSAQVVSGIFVGRDILPDEETTNEPHTFILIEQPDSDSSLFYDPANPINTTNAQFPSIFPVSNADLNTWLEAAEEKTSLLRLKEELTGKIKYYGAGKPQLVFSPERQVVNSLDAV